MGQDTSVAVIFAQLKQHQHQSVAKEAAQVIIEESNGDYVNVLFLCCSTEQASRIWTKTEQKSRNGSRSR